MNSELTKGEKSNTEIHLEAADRKIKKAEIIRQEIDRDLQLALNDRDRVLNARESSIKQLNTLRNKYNNVVTSSASLGTNGGSNGSSNGTF